MWVLKTKWIAAFAALATLATLVLVLHWALREPRAEVCWVQVDIDSYLHTRDASGLELEQSRDSFRQRELERVTSPHLIRIAIRQHSTPDHCAASSPDMSVGWMQARLKARWVAGQVMEVSLRDATADREEMRSLISGLQDAYVEEAYARSTLSRKTQIEVLRTAYIDTERELEKLAINAGGERGLRSTTTSREAQLAQESQVIGRLLEMTDVEYRGWFGEPCPFGGSESRGPWERIQREVSRALDLFR